MQISVSEIASWMAMAHYLPRWTIERKNKLLVAILHEKKMNLEDFFDYYPIQWQKEFALNEKEINDLQQATAKRVELTHLAAQLTERGIGFVPLYSRLYSPILKHNLKIKQTPALLYIIGNSDLLQKDAVAIVGSRKADTISLDFTDHLSKTLTQQGKVIVSGFANGIDKQALNSVLGYGGQSIIVLPQGIATFDKGQAQYRREIEQGNLMALSTFPPQAMWDKGLAIARNYLIYGLSSQIYVAQTAEKGGTWTGAMHGLKQKRKIFVRMPHENEKNANLLLIQRGASAVDFWGTELPKEQTTEQMMKQIIASKQTNAFLF